MSLYEKLMNEDFYKNSVYYHTSLHNIDLSGINQESCYKFIKEFFKAGGKQAVFNTNFNKDFKTNGKHVHTVVLYLLGFYFKDIIEVLLKNYIKQNIDDQLNNPESWFDFRYTWFLCCLYHDTASVIENEKHLCSRDNRFKELDYYLGKNNIKYNVYDHIPLKPESNLLTYPETLVKNYFFYRTEYYHSVDHGILGGFLIFDRLIKNYNSAWKREVKTRPEVKYDYFKSADLSWKREHQDHFVMIADSIIAHNIWFNKDKDLYKSYGLDSLIISPSNKIRIQERPLLFFLSLLDTIDPTKRFPEKDAKMVLELFDIKYYQERNELTIILKSDSNIDCVDYFYKIKKAEDWLDINVDYTDKKLTIQINNKMI